jgi:hypothetical protein
MTLPWPRWMNPPTRRRLGAALAAVLVLPWAVGEWVKSGLQPGLVERPESAAMQVDFVVIGSVVAGLSLLVVVAFGCWIVSVMRGPVREADSFPVDSPRTPP